MDPPLKGLIFVAKNRFFTRHLEAKRSVVAHFNSLDLNGDGIFSFDEFDEDMIQERSKINGERKCSNLIILSFANHESGSRSVSSVFLVLKLSAFFFLTRRPF